MTSTHRNMNHNHWRSSHAIVRSVQSNSLHRSFDAGDASRRRDGQHFSRRQWSRFAFGGLLASSLIEGIASAADVDASWQPQFMVASCMYGYDPIEVVLDQMRSLEASSIDLWPRIHGSQREDIDRIGIEASRQLIAASDVSVGCLSAYSLGPFRLSDEIGIAERLGCPLIVTMIKQKPIKNDVDAEAAIRAFAEEVKPVCEIASNAGVTIVIENHGASLIHSATRIEQLLEATRSITEGFGIAFAPAHLPQQPDQLSKIVGRIGPRLRLFYAWQYGQGFREKLPRDRQRLQLPGVGDLDFQPMFRELAAMDYQGKIEVMMHPTPRGIPIDKTPAAVTQTIARSHDYLRSLV